MSGRSFLRYPLLHFLLLGGLLFLAQDFLPRPADPIRVSAADIERLRQDWARDTGRVPTPADEPSLRVSGTRDGRCRAAARGRAA